MPMMMRMEKYGQGCIGFDDDDGDDDDDENGKVRARLHRLCRGETNQRALSAMASLSHEAP